MFCNELKEGRFRHVGGFSTLAFLFLLIGSICAVTAVAQTRTYTIDGDFDEGVLININHDSPNNDQLQLNTVARPFPFINIAASGRGTVVRIDTETGAILGEFLSAPSGRGRNPSRTTVDLYGNVWVANRNESSGGKGSVTRIGLVIGGTRVNSDGTASPTGQYLAPPYDYSTVVDRDGDGLIKTSYGLGNILPWTNAGGADDNGGVSTAEDECIINYTRVTGAGTRTVAVDANNNVWVGGTSDLEHELLSGVTGQPIPGTQISPPCGGYGGFVDGYGVLWSARNLLRYDPATSSQTCISISNSYGLAADINGNVWNSQWTNNTVTKIAPNGSILGTFATGGSGSRGVAVTSVDNNIWIANSYSNSVTRLNTSGVVLKSVPVGSLPTGVAVDANGKVWVTNHNSHNAMRIDPAGGGDGLGAVDLTVSLGGGAYPYNYSDMTGAVILTNQHGSWTVVYDGGRLGAEWSYISWTSDEPDSTSLTVQARAADLVTGLPGETFMTVGNGTPLSGLVGQFVEVRVLFDRDPGIDESPILYDLTITGVQEVMFDIKPTSCPNPLNTKGGKDMAAKIGDPSPWTIIGADMKAPVLPVAILGTADLDVRNIDPTSLTLMGEPPIRWAYEDVATPVHDDAEVCECTTAGPDGYEDLTVKFDKNSIVAALGVTYDGQVIPLTINGVLFDGVPIEGIDCVVIRGKKSDEGYACAVDPGGVTSLVRASPNPFNPITTMSFYLAGSCEYAVTIYNISGQVVCVFEGLGHTGLNEVIWDGSGNASGVYFYRLTAQGVVDTKKMLLLK